jgi:hypothetical protein
MKLKRENDCFVSGAKHLLRQGSPSRIRFK